VRVPTSILWLRRDLRLADHPALHAALDDAGDGEVLPLFVLDDRLGGPSGAPRLAFLHGALRDLAERTDGRLAVVHGDPVTVVPRVARAVAATGVHISADFGPYGHERDRAVERALEVPLVRSGSAYAVAPGRVRTGDGTPYHVFTPYSKAWLLHGWRAPLDAPRGVRWAGYEGRTSAIPAGPTVGADLPEPTEAAGLARWEAFRRSGITTYDGNRDDPALDATSRLSVYLKYGLLHPRTLLAGIDASTEGGRTFRNELCWRDFYAGILAERPEAARTSWDQRFGRFEVDDDAVADERFAAWCEGRTGYPMVDAGMRQLAAEAWVHNRLRMVVASFLVKDLHVDWARGARFFLDRLLDGDLASNHMGWQWVAGNGTDAAPFFRIFNPTTQGQKLDPTGDYVRRWVPELRGVPGKAVHTPWELPGGPPAGYPAPVVDHAEERAEALARYERVKR